MTMIRFKSTIFGSLDVDWTIIFKIDYYDFTLTAGTANPSNPDERVITIMLESEY